VERYSAAAVFWLGTKDEEKRGATQWAATSPFPNELMGGKQIKSGEPDAMRDRGEKK